MTGRGAFSRHLAAMSVLELRLAGDDGAFNGSVSYKDALYLNLIHDTEECTVSKLAELARVTRPSVTVRMNSLEDRGLIVRERSERDGRVTHIRLSDETDGLYIRESGMYEEIFDEMRGLYGDEAMDTFLEILDGMSDRVMERAGEGSKDERAVRHGGRRGPSGPRTAEVSAKGMPGEPSTALPPRTNRGTPARGRVVLINRPGMYRS